jgi:hypothetical protein
MEYTAHYNLDRSNREALISKIGQGKVIKGFIVDRGHKDGKEAHMITDNAIIVIYNYNTKRLVTKLIARPGQIRRYYKGVNQVAPQWLLQKAYDHEKLGYNT